MMNRIWRALLLAVLALNLGMAGAATSVPIPLSGVFDTSTNKLIGIVPADVPGATRVTPALITTQQSSAGATGIGGFDATGRLLKPDGTGAADSVNTLLAPYPPSPTTDMTAAIQTVINAASAACSGCTTGHYVRVAFPPVAYSITGLTLPVGGNVWLDFDHATFTKIAGGTGVAANSMLRTVDALVGGTTWYGNYDNIRLSGGTFLTNNVPCSAQIIRLENVRDLVVEHMRVVHSANAPNWAFEIGGQRIRITDSAVIGGTQTFQDGFHFTQGDNIVASGLYSEAGDDAFAFGTDVSGGSGTEAFNAGLTNLTLSNSVAKSTSATAIKIYYGQNTVTGQPFAGTKGTIDGITLRGITGAGGILSNGGVYIVDTTKLTLASGVSSATATLSTPYTGVSDANCFLIFDTGAVRGAAFVNGSPSVTLTSSVTAGTAVQQVCPSRIQNVDIDANLTVGSALNNGETPFGLFVQGATNVRYRGTMKFVDTPNLTLTWASAPLAGATTGTLNANYTGPTNATAAITFATSGEVRSANLQNGSPNVSWVGIAGGADALASNSGATATVNGFAACSVNEVIGGDFVFSSPAMPHGAGCGFFNSRDINVHDGRTVGSGNSRGVVEGTGVNNLRVHDMTFSDIPSNGAAFIAQGVGSGDFPNAFQLHHNQATKATGATVTRFYIQQSNGAGFVPYVSITDNDIRGWSNGKSIDQGFNTTTTPDYAYVNGNRGFIPNASAQGTLAIAYNANIATALLNGVGGHYTIALTGNTTIAAPTGAIMGARITYTFTQDATGGRTVTWNSVFKFYSAAWVDAQVTTDANKSTSITFECDASGNWIQVAPNRYAFAPEAANDAVYELRAVA